MIKVQGLGRRRPGMSHAECIAHHRQIHSKLGLAQADHLARYVLYYFQEAFDASGQPLADFPWDMSALEWFRDPDYWTNFQEWLEAAPDGLEVKTDEANFLERDKCFMLPYADRIVVEGEAPGEPIILMRLLRFRAGTPPDEAVLNHAGSLKALQARFGHALRKLVVNSITEATCLASGPIPWTPVDVVEIFTFDRAAFADPRDVVRIIATDPILHIFDSANSFNLLAEEVSFISGS